MPFKSVTSYSDRSVDPQVQDWIARGGIANNQTLRAMSDAMATFRANNMLVGQGAAGVGIHRLNFFCGASLAEALIPLIDVGALGADSNFNFVSADFVNIGDNGGLTGNGTSKYLKTGVHQDDITDANDLSAIGAFVTENIAEHATNRQCLIGARETSSDYMRIELNNNGVDSISFNGMNSAAKLITAVPPYTENPSGATASIVPGLYTSERYATTDHRALFNATDLGTQTQSVALPSATRDYWVFTLNDNNSPSGKYTNGTLGGYFLWAGTMTSGQKTANSSAWNQFASDMGRRHS